MVTSIVEIRGLTKHFGGLTALDNVSMSVNRGEMVGLIGPNGSGKTTLFNLMTGFLRPSSGQIIFKRENVIGLNTHQIARKGMIRSWQQSEMFGEMTVIANLMLAQHLQIKYGFWQELFGLKSARMEEKMVKQRATELLKDMGLAPFGDELAKNLPHGFQRTLGVAMALATKPDLLLLDEPLTGLNLAEIDFMLARLREIRDRGVTLLLVEHNMEAVMDFCQRVVVLNFGKIIAEGSPEEIVEHNDVIEAYLGADIEV